MKLITLLAMIFLWMDAVAESVDAAQARHALNRLTYGPKPGEAEALAQKGQSGINEWFEKQLNPSTTEIEPILLKLKSFKTIQASSQQLSRDYPKKSMEMEGEGKPAVILRELFLKKLILATESENQFREVMADFWFNHFNVSFDKGKVKWLITSYERDAIRPHIFGKFEDLLMATAKDPAMLFYLDNVKSRNQNINENYARELLELHTLGVEGGYTQKDIQETARVLTGWGIDQQLKRFVFRPRQHDPGEKSILGQTYSGRDNLVEGEKLIRALAHHPSTAKNIARKLALKFISDRPSEAAIADIARVFTDSKGDLKEVYRALFKAPEFWKAETRLNKIKTPLEFFASSIRATDARIQTSTERFPKFREFFAQSGQDIYRCQPPTGFKATSDFWVNPGALINRINLSLRITAQQIPQVDFNEKKLLTDLADKKFKNAKEIFKILNAKLFSNTIKDETLDKLSAQITEVKNYQDNERQELPFYYFPITKMLALMLSAPEMQRR